MSIKGRYFLIAAVIAATSLVTSPLIALEARTFRQACTGQGERNFGFCMGFIGGMFEGYNLIKYYENLVLTAQGLTPENEYLCLPENFMYEDMPSKFLEFLDENPGFLEEQIYVEVAIHAWFSEEFFDCK